MSMTLLVPQVTNPNYTKASTLDWEAIRIEMPAMDGQHGIRVELDSGSSVCLISKCVTDEIRKTWHKEEDIFVKELLIPGGKRSGCCVLLWGSALLSQPLEKRRRLPPTFHTTNRT
ncbi:hypothetical protein BD309DRAFT_957493 [Dichomitus squalens]|nr:hypothetical protein BD309DRAFT_957493 [Dichomitus squalens]